MHLPCLTLLKTQQSLSHLDSRPCADFSQAGRTGDHSAQKQCFQARPSSFFVETNLFK